VRQNYANLNKITNNQPSTPTIYANGKASDLPVVKPLENDRALVPKNDDPEAKWQCEVPKADGKENETKDIKDVGEFVRFCVVPAMKAR